ARPREPPDSPRKVPDRPVPRFCNRMAAINAMLTMIWPSPRIGVTLRSSPVGSAGRCYHSLLGRPSVVQERPPGDPGPAGQTGELEERGGDVGKDTVGQLAILHGRADEHERDGIQRVCRDGRAHRVTLLVSVAVV